MNNNDYAFGVAKIRALENTLLSHTQYEQLITAKNTDECVMLLSSFGYEGTTGEEILKNAADKLWDTVDELLEDGPAKRFLTLNNDFNNLKAAVKCLFADKDVSEYYVYPTSLDVTQLYSMLADKDYSILPVYMRQCGIDAYEILSSTGDGQLAEILIDHVYLKVLRELAKECESTIFVEFAELAAAFADIKTAYRAASVKKSDTFLSTALSDSEVFGRTALIKAAVKGKEEVLSLVSQYYEEEANALKNSFSEFEKISDIALLSVFGASAMQSFGVEPIAAYYFNKINDIKNIRIILTCKDMGVDNSVLSERVRERNA